MSSTNHTAPGDRQHPDQGRTNSPSSMPPDFRLPRESLQAVFESGTTRPLSWRTAQLKAVLELLQREEDTLLQALASDMGKPSMEAWLSEVGFCQNEARHALKNLHRWTRSRKVSVPMIAQPAKSWIQPEPLGVVLVIGAWNYPLQLIVAPLIAAIAAGNCAVLKPSELAPATASAIARLLPAYLDKSAFLVVEGAVAETTALLELPWDHILYTGGGGVGRIVMRAAAKHLTPVTLELGGKSPCIIRPGVDLKTVAQRLCWGKFMNAGQTCVAPDYVLTDAATEQALLPLLAATISEQFGDDPQRSESYSRIINPRHAARIAGLLEGQTIAVGGEVDVEKAYVAPTVLGGVAPDDPIMAGEIFGPVLPIVRSESLSDALRFVNAREKPLAAYLFSKDREEQQRFLRELSCGSAGINDVIMFHAVPELPFGGVGASGMGRYSGSHGFRTFSHEKAVLRRGLWPEIKLRYAPYTTKALQLIRRLS